MDKVSISLFKSQVTEWINKSLIDPVIIMRRDKPISVILSYEKYLNLLGDGFIPKDSMEKSIKLLKDMGYLEEYKE